MKRVVYRAFPNGAKEVQFHFVVPRKKYWYDRNVQPVVDAIIDLVPADERVNDGARRSWSVAPVYWITISEYLKRLGFAVESVSEADGSGETLRDFAWLAIYLIPLMFLIQGTEVLHHFFHFPRSGLNNRLCTFVSLASIAALSLRFRNWFLSATLCLFAVILGPFGSFWIPDWWQWQLATWISIILACLAVMKNMMKAENERREATWWRYLPTKGKAK